MQTRTPKASHCGLCGNCIQGWDHHCTALNNCVGYRNIRSFVGFLICSFTFAATVLCSCLYLLMIGREGYSESSLELRVGSLLSAIFAILTFQIMIRPYITNRFRLGVFIIGTLVTFSCLMPFCRGLVQYLAALTFYITVGYMTVIKGMLSDYLDLVARKMTMKEDRARKQCLKDLELPPAADFKTQPVPFNLKVKRFLRFFLKKSPPSVLKADYKWKLIERNRS